jgi:hypothetical protein
MRLSDTADSFVFIRKAYDVSMTYALASNAKAMTAIRTLLAVMVFSGTSIPTLRVTTADTLTSHSFGFFYVSRGHLLGYFIPVCPTVL